MITVFKTSRKGSADLLLEVIFSSIIFFVIVLFLFAVKIPGLQLNTLAHVISSDSAMACELSLTNVLRADSSKSITYGDLLINEFVQKKDLDKSSWKSEVESLFNKALSKGEWDLNVSLPNGTVILHMGGIKDEAKKTIEIFGCKSFVPYPAAYAQKFCFPAFPDAKDMNDGSNAKFELPDGNIIECKIIINREEIGFVQSKSCNLSLQAKNVFETDLPSKLANSPEILNSLTLPISVANINYKITINETQEGQKAAVSLKKRALLEDCALQIDLRSTNVSISA